MSLVHFGDKVGRRLDSASICRLTQLLPLPHLPQGWQGAAGCPSPHFSNPLTFPHVFLDLSCPI